jgi:hypothetical protein
MAEAARQRRPGLSASPITLTKRRDRPGTCQLRESIVSRSFLALGVPARHAERVAAGLMATFGAAEVNISEVLLDTLKSRAEQAGVPWNTVLEADAASTGTVDAPGLSALVGQASRTCRSPLTKRCTMVLTDAWS